ILTSTNNIIPLFHNQIIKNKPITITNPKITHYFITIPKTCQLILQTTTSTSHNTIYTLNINKPIPIQILTKQIIHL
ncbi:polysaccharide biosynthesis protein, partial [Escherichia coli]|nr:polysaccharide biosynthesis protein [Escherichia coli]